MPGSCSPGIRTDWKRLSAEGFRIVEPGIRRKLLLLNSECILSSHPAYVFGGFERDLYGNSMNWRFVFLRHGVTKDDMSHWLSGQPFDLIVSSTPGSMRRSRMTIRHTPSLSVRCVALDFPGTTIFWQRQASFPANDVNIVLVMPTWRGSLADERSGDASLQAFAGKRIC